MFWTPVALCRHCEEQSDEAIHPSVMPRHGLLRCARNDADADVITSYMDLARTVNPCNRCLHSQAGDARKGRSQGLTAPRNHYILRFRMGARPNPYGAWGCFRSFLRKAMPPASKRPSAKSTAAA